MKNISTIMHSQCKCMGGGGETELTRKFSDYFLKGGIING